MQVTLLGTVAVQGHLGRFRLRGVQPGLVLARLVLERPRPLSRDELADLLWGDAPPAHWPGAARHVLARARAVLVAAGIDEATLTSARGSATIGLGAVTVDVETAALAVADAESALTAGGAGADAAAVSARVSLDLTRLPFVPGAEGPWVEQWRTRLIALRRRAQFASAEAALRLARPDDAGQLAVEALALDPLDETAARLAMAAHEASGNRAAALAVYEQLRRALDEALGVRPSPETEAAFVRMLGTPPAGPAAPLPPRRASRERSPFIGRRAELQVLADAWRDVREGATRAIAIEGEAGIGKTRLGAEFATAAGAEAETQVVWGRCSADGAVHFQPFDELLTELARRFPDIVAARPAADDLAPLLEPAPDFAGDAQQARSRMFRAVRHAIEGVAAKVPLLIVIDDLQWARPDALDLLRYVVGGLDGSPCLFMIMVRDPNAAVGAALADLQAAGGLTTRHLAGLSVDDVATLLRQSGHPDDPSLALTVTERTAGNPLYVTQLIVEADGSRRGVDPLAVPGAVADLLRRRLAALDPPIVTTLVLAAVTGPVFDLATLEACSTDVDVLGAVEELCRLRFLDEQTPGTFTFVHQLVRDAVLGTVSATRRQRLHQRVADVLAATGAEPALLAFHYRAAGPASGVIAAAWSATAGERALRDGAWAEARLHFDAAVEHSPSSAARCRAMVGLARAQRGAGHVDAARALLEDALALARTTADGAGAGAATLALVGGGGRGVATEMPDHQRAAMLKAALADIDRDGSDAGPGLLVAILGELALALVLTPGTEEERSALCRRCVDEARAWGDDDGLASAVATNRIALMGPPGTAARAAEAAEVLARPIVAIEHRLAAQLALVEDQLELGDRDHADAALAAATLLADELGHPYWSWAACSWRSLSATIDGRLDDAAALAVEALGHQAPADHPEAVAAFGVETVNQRLFSGAAGDVVDLLRGAADERPNIPCYRAVLALCCAEAGDLEQARGAFEVLAAGRFDMPRDSNWLLAVAVLADTCATLRDHDRANDLTELLEPWADRQVVLNCYGGGGAWWGPVTHHLGRLAALRRDRARARRLLDDAVQRSEAFRAPLFAARSRAELTRV